MKLTLADYEDIHERATKTLGFEQTRYEVLKPAYPEGFIPDRLASALAYFNFTKRQRDAALAESDAAREDEHR
jgi:hypothetical protein